MPSSVTSVIRVVGFHNWPGAPSEVGYLASRHRHLFTIKATWSVTHDDRDVEFHMAQRWLRDAVIYVGDKSQPTVSSEYEFGSRSCEMIGHRIGIALREFKRPAPTHIEIGEDDENWATVYQPYVAEG